MKQLTNTKLIVSPNDCFEIYKQFDREIRSAAIQCSLMQSLYEANDLYFGNYTLRQFMLARRTSIESRIKNKQSFGQYITKNEMRDIYTLDNEQRSGFWRLKLKGQPICRKYVFQHLFRVIASKAKICIHPLFRLLNDFSLLEETPFVITSPLNEVSQRRLFSRIPVSRYYFDDIPAVWKESYQQQRKQLSNDITLDSLTVILLQTIYQQYFLGKPSVVKFESLIWHVFEKLFCVKYPIYHIDLVADKIGQLLHYFQPHHQQKTKQQNVLDFEKIKSTLVKKQHAVHSSLNAVVFSSEHYQQRLSLLNNNSLH